MTFYTHYEIAEMLQVDPKTVVRQIKAGWLNAMKIGSKWRITQDQFNEYCDDRTVKFKRSSRLKSTIST